MSPCTTGAVRAWGFSAAKSRSGVLWTTRHPAFSVADERIDRFEVFPCRAAAVVPDPPEDRDIPVQPQSELGSFGKALLDVVAFRVIESDRDAVGQDLRAIHALPAVEIGRDVEFGLLWTHVDIHPVARLVQHLGESAAVAERIEVVRDRRVGIEVFGEEASAFRDMPDDGLDQRQIHVGLQIPSAADVPAAGAHAFLDGTEQCGVVALHPPVEDGFVVVEDQARDVHRACGPRCRTSTGLRRILPPIAIARRDRGVHCRSGAA